MEQRKKELATQDFMATIEKSWTWDRLTKEERERFKRAVSAWGDKVIKGTWKQRWNILCAMHSAFLIALDYKTIGWREPAGEESPQF
jgi:hypothetical protein